jgi:tRNA dimethylallyltransferase
MAAAQSKPELIAIVGPTASGKSELALRIAKEFNGEIISADSRSIYIGMDIGTAKPTHEEQKRVRHWGLNLIEPGQPYSAFKFKNYAEHAISDIKKRGKMPIIVGGTGLYVDAVLFGYRFSATDTEPDIQNPRHRRRGSYKASPRILNPAITLIGIEIEPQKLKKRIAKRAQFYFKKGLIREMNELLNKYDPEVIMTSGGIAYKVCLAHINKQITQKEAQELIYTKEWQYVKRQKTWFRRNKFIQWYKSPNEAFTSVKITLNK